MTVTFKQFSSFISEAEGEQSPEKLTEIWDKILGKKEADKDKKEQDDKAKGKVLTAKEKLEKKKEDEEERKNELKKKRDAAWQNAKDHTEGRKKASVFGKRDDYVLHKMREGKDEELSASQKKALLADFEEWSGGFSPDECPWKGDDKDEMSVSDYIESGLPTDLPQKAAKALLRKLTEGKDEDHEEWQAGYGFGKSMRKKNKTASTEEINDMSKAYKQGYMKALNESLDEGIFSRDEKDIKTGLKFKLEHDDGSHRIEVKDEVKPGYFEVKVAGRTTEVVKKAKLLKAYKSGKWEDLDVEFHD